MSTTSKLSLFDIALQVAELDEAIVNSPHSIRKLKKAANFLVEQLSEYADEEDDGDRNLDAAAAKVEPGTMN